MQPHFRPLAEQVIVITGGSSGIGRATALAAARAGARVVIAARGAEALAAAEREIAAAGGEVLAVQADVADYAQVEELGRRAVARFGRIDTWVNNASVSIYGELPEITPEEFRQVIHVNLLGVVHGSMVALAHLPETGGTIVNVSSGLGERSVPLQTAYCAAKAGVIGFDEALRAELAHGGRPIQVVSIKPSSINTPFFAHARTKRGVQPRPFPPVYDPDLVATAILHAATNPARDLPVGGAGAFLTLVEQITPGLLDRALARIAYPAQLTDKPKGPAGLDTLFTGSAGTGAIRGEFRATGVSPHLWLTLHPRARRAMIAGALAVGLALARRRSAV
jgi:NAD(P)-dependent dehydrogenase (short-subunit alcohol dehydrogenase family)